MKYFGEGLSEQHKELSRLIRKEACFGQAKALFLELHAKLSPSQVSGTAANEVDRLLEGLERADYAVMPTAQDETIAWVLWHIARIEDLTINMLVARKEQIFDGEWKKRLNVTITDTGNALSDDEIMELSQEIRVEELLRYRNEVTASTRRTVEELEAGEMKRKIAPADLERVLAAGGVTTQAESIWLLDFWGKKDVAGILLMPPTRHVMLHLNDCCKWKESLRTKKKYYRKALYDAE